MAHSIYGMPEPAMLILVKKSANYHSFFYLFPGSGTNNCGIAELQDRKSQKTVETQNLTLTYM
jgi:hypothetical protein